VRDEWRDADRRQSRSNALEDRKRDNGEEPIPDIEPDLPAHDAASLTGLIAAQAHEAKQPARRFTAWSLATLLRRSMSCARSISKCPEGFIQILDAFGYGRDAVCAILEIIPSRKFRSLDRVGCAVRECGSILLREGATERE
jgi:hypothetical protein